MSWRCYKKDPRRSRWTVAGRDHMGVKRQIPAFASHDLSRELAHNIAKVVEYKRQGAPLPPMLAAWVQDLAPDPKDKLAEFGLLDSHTRPLHEHLADYEHHLASKDNTASYVRQTIGRIKRVIDGCRSQYWTDVRGSNVQRLIAGLRSSKTRSSSAQTRNYYLRDFKSFARWCVRDGRLPQSPVEHMRPLEARRVRLDRRHERRALTTDEAHRLLGGAQHGPDRHGMTGPERAMLYRLAIETGLRAGEVRSLTRSSFDVTGNEPTVAVQAAYSKNRQTATIPLRDRTAEDLSVYLAGKMPAAKAFNLPKKDRVVEMLRADLEAAGIDYRDDSDRVFDFHALRHTCGSWLAAVGVHPKVIQRVMRHSTITLTMDKYTHLFNGDEAAAVAKLPDLSEHGRETARATGTDNDNTLVGSRGAQRGAHGGPPWTNDPGPVDSSPPVRHRGQSVQTPINTGGLTCGQASRTIPPTHAGVAELADATDSKSVCLSAQTASPKQLTSDEMPPGARNGARSFPDDPELEGLVEVWPDLQPAVRAGILAMVAASRLGESW